MKTILLQFWEESERGWGVKPDGASLHINIETLRNYIKDIYSNRDENHIPQEYDRIVGNPIEVKVTDSIYEIVSISKTMRIPQYQLNNLIKLKDIIVNE
jgi:hypothetical protein